MAIDDNKLYNLKGSQLKDLSSKIKAKADQADTYTKAEVDGLIPDVSDFVTGQELTDGLALKADKATTYTKTEVDDLVDAKEDTGTVFDANTDYDYATMSNALGKGLVYVTTNGTNRILVTHSNNVASERDITLYTETGSGTSTGQTSFRWIDGAHQALQREYVYPTGGTTGQVLAKRSNVNADVEWVNAASGGGNADFTLDTTNNFATIQNQGQGMSFDFSDADGITVTASDPGTYQNSKKLATQDYVDGVVGDLTTLTTTAQTDTVSAINELKSIIDALGESFRVKDWNVEGTLNATIPSCNQDIANTSIDKIVYRITGQEATDYQIVGMLAYQILDANGARINAWPVCQFTGQNQTELNVRFMCAGTTNKTATTIKAWVILKHR